MELKDIVRVTLTGSGADILNKANTALQQRHPSATFKTDYAEGETYQTELWELMQRYGRHFYNGTEELFTGLEKVKVKK